MRAITRLIPVVLIVAAAGFTQKHKPAPYQFPKLAAFPTMPESATNPVTIEGADLGRYLFYDPILSSDRSLSCSSCHKQAFAFSDSPNMFSKGMGGELQARNTLPLYNLAWYPALFWDGKAGSIEEQVFHPVRTHNEMNLKWDLAVERIRSSRFYKPRFKAAFGNTPIDSMLIAKAIAQFERTLLSYRSKFDRVMRNEDHFTKEEREGFILVNDQTKGNCLHCHTTDANGLGTTLTFSNNGLDEVSNAAGYKDKGRGSITHNEKDNGKFKVPSLRNVALTAPYMHDGRFSTLEEVLEFYSEGVKQSPTIDSKMGPAHKQSRHLTQEEKKNIIAFLKTLTDSAFITDPAFSDPFAKKK